MIELHTRLRKKNDKEYWEYIADWKGKQDAKTEKKHRKYTNVERLHGSDKLDKKLPFILNIWVQQVFLGN